MFWYHCFFDLSLCYLVMSALIVLIMYLMGSGITFAFCNSWISVCQFFFFFVLSIDIIFPFLVNNICSVNVITVSIILWCSFYPGWVVSCSGIKHCFNSLTCEEGIAKYKGYQLVNLIFVFFLNSGAWVRALGERKGSFFNKHTQMETQIL